MNEEPKMEVSTVQSPGVEVAMDLKEIIEALLFASDEQVTLDTLRVVFDDMNRDKPDAENQSNGGRNQGGDKFIKRRVRRVATRLQNSAAGRWIRLRNRQEICLVGGKTFQRKGPPQVVADGGGDARYYCIQAADYKIRGRIYPRGER